MSCSTKEEKIVDIDDIMPSSQRDYNQDTTKPETNDTTTVFKERFVNNGIDAETLVHIEKRLFPDRVGPIRSEKFKIHDGEFNFEYYNWTFSDSAKVMNAFYNWMDVLGIEQVGVESRIQDEYLCILVGDTNLIYINGSVGSVGREWLNYHKAIGFDEDWNYMVEQYASRRAEWYQFSEGEKEAIKN